MAQLSTHADGLVLTIEQAAERAAERVAAVAGIETVALAAADGRVLAQDVVAPLDLPPFANSAVDGYAVRFADLAASGETRLPVSGRVPAGTDAAGVTTAGMAVRVFTGAPMPPDADTVFMQEDVKLEAGTVLLPAGLKRGANARAAGEDLPRGQTALAAGRCLRPQDLARSACVVVSTIQAFRVANTTGRKVYSHHEELEPHFSGVPTDGMEVVSHEEAAENDMLTEGAVKFSFANLLYHQRPLMIVDEAHNAVSGLTREVQARIRPAAIVEFTATPRGRNNILHSVTASALKDEEMIKLPIRVRPHDDWREAVTGAVATRNMLEEKAKRDRDHIRPVVLYQAQARNGHPTVAELKKYLIEEKLIPEDRIKIATGEQRELDGVNLRDPAEQTRHVITVDALKEGWDCSFAYVFCSLASIRSGGAVEQLLGRVLRMPSATRRSSEELNRAYAHVSERNFFEAAEGLKDRLTQMGFDERTALEAIVEQPEAPDTVQA